MTKFGDEGLPFALTQPVAPSNDHDILIQLHTLFFEMRNEIRISNDGIIKTLGEQSERIRKLEDARISLNAEERMKRFDAGYDWIILFRERWKMYAAIGIAIVTFLSSVIVRVITKGN